MFHLGLSIQQSLILGTLTNFFSNHGQVWKEVYLTKAEGSTKYDTTKNIGRQFGKYNLIHLENNIGNFLCGAYLLLKLFVFEQAHNT